MPGSTPGMSSHIALQWPLLWTLHHKIFQFNTILNFDLMNVQKKVEYCNFGLISSTMLHTLMKLGGGNNMDVHEHCTILSL